MYTNSSARHAPDPDTLLERLEHALIAGRLNRRGFIKAVTAAGLVSTGLPALADELDAIRANQNERAAALLPAYDYVVIGTGSAGSALVGRLAAQRNASILVIEAGDWDTAPSVLDPGVWFTNLGSERDWQDVAIPSAGTNNRAIPEHMGKVVGGGSSINATIWARPFKSDLEHWAQVSGDAAWGYEHGLSIYRRMENWQGKPDARYRGQGGPVWCQPAHNPHPAATAMLAACRSLGLPVLDDQNGAREEGAGGFALMNQIIRDGRRQSIARSYLYPVLAQKNVTLLVKTHVDRLTFSGTRATGVEISLAGATRRIEAKSEVIVCSGGINTPKLLMLSGIGNEADLRAHGIKTLVNAPEVGQNFQDHLLHGGCIWEPKEHIPHRNSAANAAGFIKSDARLATPDLNLVQIELPYASDVVGKQYSPPNTSWALCAGLVAPKSRGAIKLRSANPTDRPIVDARFLSHPDDVKALAHGIEVCREIGNSAAMRDFVKREVAPGQKLTGQPMEDFVRNGATTYFHQAGTCRMGRDAQAVVDAQLRVNGVQNLRIADSSIMPRIPGVATMATCALIGERMAQILGKSA
ncbi:glucose-methanol-choline oxidoreductase [Leptothrix cholodnii SP-6]|uniref:Glucose-methanol-choline oxidoreductase n=1 Tax=Leptothrix cholodnii (strain ATCC 51168 / LMG 8142 / SP-6) TaxID=395495 RepID=B1Y198_LEPCP|nr:GMC family oxidoreductase N-terminal domain-containing protein [Leptothrix cholodnii]ACB33075.1 glucose-methanol-choline oxidoreductase [Leptothrix cholodnii SP-6]